MQQAFVLKVAVPGPFQKTFDYLAPKGDDSPKLSPGMRVLVPFGQRKVIGIYIEKANLDPDTTFKLKHVLEFLDETPVIDKQTLAWLVRVSQYYHHPLGETLLTALPVLLRKEKHPKTQRQKFWQIINTDASVIEKLKRAPKQLAIYQYLLQLSANQHDSDRALIDQKDLLEQFPGATSLLKELEKKQFIRLVEKSKINSISTTSIHSKKVTTLNSEQQKACEIISSHLNTFQVMLLEGITGSGKTEVYISTTQKVIASGKQVLLLLPEIALTPQLVSRFRNQLDCEIEVLHSGLNDSERYSVWEKIRNKVAQIIIGTRSSIFSPFQALGLIIIDEEHDLSFKQQEGLRYSTRDIAILRAKSSGIPVILGSATPSLESMANIEKPHFKHLRLKKRAGQAIPPKIQTLDIKGQQLTDGLSNSLIKQMHKHLEKNEQVLLFLNQRGYAPALICHQCGEVEKCPRCDRNMTIHQARSRITCHHCAYEKKLPLKCPQCGHDDLRPIGYGTERIENCLKSLFPNTDVIRIDRDTTTRKNALLNLLQKVKHDTGQILLGTQMLAKGHDFPNVTLVGILNADQGLFGADLRSEERLAQLITQVAGRAGRGETPGLVLIQTHHPEHELWNTLIQQSYNAYAQKALSERKQAKLPPYSFAALFRADSTQLSNAMQFLMDLKQSLPLEQTKFVEIYGPVSAPMEKRAGKFRTQLLLLSDSRDRLHNCISLAQKQIEQLQSAKRVRWSVDVDPLDMS